jgi:hypothetical protein
MVHNELAKYKNLKENAISHNDKIMHGDIETLEEDPSLMEKVIRKDMLQHGIFETRRLKREVRNKRKKVSQEMNNLLF